MRLTARDPSFCGTPSSRSLAPLCRTISGLVRGMGEGGRAPWHHPGAHQYGRGEAETERRGETREGGTGKALLVLSSVLHPSCRSGLMTRFEIYPIARLSERRFSTARGLYFLGRRIDGPEHVDMTHDWQMLQGGLDPGEDAYACALRELHEAARSSTSRRSTIGSATTFRARSSARRGRENIAASRKNGSRCASSGTRAMPGIGQRPTFRWPAAAGVPTVARAPV